MHAWMYCSCWMFLLQANILNIFEWIFILIFFFGYAGVQFENSWKCTQTHHIGKLYPIKLIYHANLNGKIHDFAYFSNVLLVIVHRNAAAATGGGAYVHTSGI